MTTEIDAEAATSVPRWYLVQSRPRQAERAELNLAQQGYQVFHPRMQVERVRRGRRVLVEESLFPNYLFILLQRWVDNWYPLRSTRGVARLVSFGQEPLPVPDALIDEIRRRAEGLASQPVLEVGEPVQIIAGPFHGIDAIFKAHQGEQRVQLLIELLHREVCVTLPLENIQRIA
ncbi:MAG: transcription/translation regulatory transformer protein RfaH [Sphingobacteriia bacterium]|nr:transcription/translation regulatory transformer protein RfaH [Sphingobacteriia bacterium]NCC39119.1 transcription/translation regulatory transformer protein RfaH [Gammaproteobacteria bacterium]